MCWELKRLRSVWAYFRQFQFRKTKSVDFHVLHICRVRFAIYTYRSRCYENKMLYMAKPNLPLAHIVYTLPHANNLTNHKIVCVYR